MSDEPPPTLQPAVMPKAGPSKAMLGLLVLNLLGTGFVAFKVLTAAPAAASTKPAHPPAATSSEVTGPVVALDPFVVNLDEPGTSRYLKVTLELELMPQGEAALNKSKQLVRDTILSHLSGLHVKDTLGTGAKDKIRADLMAKLGKLLGPERVRRMFFVDFVVQ
ncbi:MAG: flagellar basal body-associated FliL family protein [Myxococcales bacterium]|nr:flagellar basal body-associated FliL family protein [Myxococcales bacterium]